MELVRAIAGLFAPVPLFFCIIGTTLGVTVGAIPGLTGSMLIALTLPLTFYMNPIYAMVLLVSMYVGGISGGMISATLLRMPGTPSSMMTTFDAYPMASNGQPGRALGLGITASFVGGLVSWVFLVTLAKPMSEIAIRFGPFEYFSLVAMAMVLISTISQGSMLKGLLAGFLGMLFALPGMDISSGYGRLTFGFHELEGGFGLLPVLIGIFAFNQLLRDAGEARKKPVMISGDIKGVFLSFSVWKENFANMIRSSLIGTWIGILPGVGADLGSMLSYTAAKNASKHPETFGTGEPAGIIASEAGNNATINGAMIPLLALGVPGSIITAILLGALVLHGVQPGPFLFINNPEIVYALMATTFVANIIMFLLLSFLGKYMGRITQVSKPILIPVVLLFCVVGTFSIANRIFDVVTMIAFGIIGYFLERSKVSLQPFVIGFILAPIGERYLRSGLMISRGSLVPIITRPLSAIFIIAAVLMLIWPIIPWMKNRLQTERTEVPKE